MHLFFSKFDLKSGFWQIQITEKDKYKTTFNLPFGQYEWNVMPFGLKNAPSKFQNLMNNIFNPYQNFILVYINDILIFSQSIDQHWKHLAILKYVIQKNGLALSKRKLKLFQTFVNFLGYHIKNQTITPIKRVIQIIQKFPDQITNKKQLQWFLGCLNYVLIFVKDFIKERKLLQNRLQKNSKIEWTP